jgi:hypothetical protein
MKWYKDPLVTFLVIGALLFVFAGWFEAEEISYDIDVRAADVQRLTDQWAMQMRRPPTGQELDGLIDQFVREEIYYREALRLGLDANDTIVRRRMVQKLTFITEDIATSAPPDEATLEAYYDEHHDDYRLPDRYSFKHRYFSSDRRENAEGDARAAMANPDEPGDPFMLQREYASRSEREIGDLFGREFATGIAMLSPSDEWQGPIKSAYGFHAVLVTRRQPTTLQPFADVKDRVAIDWQQSTRRKANEQYFEDLTARYSISFPEPEAG